MSDADRPGPDGDLEGRAEAIRRTREEMTRTLEELKRRLDPETLKTQVSNMMRSSDGSSGIAETLRAHPVPIAMIGLGIGWLLIEQSGAAEGAGRRARSARHRLGERMHDVRGRAERAAHDTRERVRHAMERAGHSAEEAAERARHLGERARARVSGGMHETDAGYSGRDASPAYGGRPVAGQAGDDHDQEGYGRRATRAIGSGARQAQGSFWHLVDDYPLAAGLMGLALGAAIGAAIPSSRYEDEWMGGIGDEIRDRGSRYGREAIDRGEEVARAAYEAGSEAARGEAEHQGREMREEAGAEADRASRTG
jgi:hypothetical protein